MCSLRRICSLVSVICLVPKVAAQSHTFNWGFNVNVTNQELQECQTLPILVLSLDNNPEHLGVPPYYLIAFEVDGVPTTTNLGSDTSNLMWKNTHKRGSDLMITIVDSNTTSSGIGGVDAPLYSTVAGSDTSCLPSSTDKSKIATISPNVTDTLSTCEEWGLTITGGQKPYTVVLSALNSPIITNITMGAEDNTLTWPNRADPGGQLMASVVGVNGNWGVSSATVHTTGLANVSCGNLLPSSSSSSQQAPPLSQGTSSSGSPKATKSPAGNDTKSQPNLGLELGLGIGIGIPTLLGLAAALYFCLRRKNRREQGTWDSQPWQAPLSHGLAGFDVREVDAAGGATSPPMFKHSRYGTSGSPSSTPFMQVEPIPGGYYSDLEQPTVPPMPTAGSSRSTRMAGTQDCDPNFNAQYRKTQEALQEREYGVSPSMSSIPMSALSPSFGGSDVPPGIIIQHQDGGVGVVQELPPPYVDRSLRQDSAFVTIPGPDIS